MILSSFSRLLLLLFCISELFSSLDNVEEDDKFNFSDGTGGSGEVGGVWILAFLDFPLMGVETNSA